MKNKKYILYFKDTEEIHDVLFNSIEELKVYTDGMVKDLGTDKKFFTYFEVDMDRDIKNVY